LSATLSPSGAPEIGRLVNYMLLAASTQTERKHPVFLVIDEFQRMVAGNLEYMLQLARSMGIGVILANQSMEDLKKSSVNLIPAIEANCRLRQWFSVSCQRRPRTTDQEQR
jgi:type IV secretory pathway TraG/TraD family ATPase VirD4